MKTVNMKWLGMFVLLLLALSITPSYAWGGHDDDDDDGPPAVSQCGFLKDLPDTSRYKKKKLFGICKLYCDRLNCVNNDQCTRPKKAAKCEKLLTKFTHLAPEGVTLPCIPPEASVSLEKLLDGEVVIDETTTTKEIGSEIVFTYRITNTGDASVDINSLLDISGGVSVAIDPGCDVPRSLEVGDMVECTSTQLAVTGLYHNEAEVRWSVDGVDQPAARASSGYTGVEPATCPCEELWNDTSQGLPVALSSGLPFEFQSGSIDPYGEESWFMVCTGSVIDNNGFLRSAEYRYESSAATGGSSAMRVCSAVGDGDNARSESQVDPNGDGSVDTLDEYNACKALLNDAGCPL